MPGRVLQVVTKTVMTEGVCVYIWFTLEFCFPFCGRILDKSEGEEQPWGYT